jgi:hypothetical protein
MLCAGSWAAWTFSAPHPFEAGYRAGVKHVCTDCEVIAHHAGVTPVLSVSAIPGVAARSSHQSGNNQGVNVIFSGREQGLVSSKRSAGVNWQDGCLTLISPTRRRALCSRAW